MDKKRLKLGMVGGGTGAFIGAVHRIAARMDDRYEMVAGCLSSTPEKALRSAEEIGLAPERSYGTYQEMAEQEKARPDGIDMVAVVTPNHMHFPVVKCFWEHGFHVICDKPMTRSLEEAEELHSLLSMRPNQVYTLTHNYTGYPMVRQARQMVQEGRIGAIRFVELKYIQGWFAQPVQNKQVQWRTDPAQAGLGGALGDIATHAHNLGNFITGLEIEQLAAQLKIFVPGRPLDDNVQMLLRYRNGAVGQLWASQVAIGEENGLQIAVYGELGSLKWQQEDPNYLTYIDQEGIHQRFTRAGAGAYDTKSCRTPAGHPEAFLEGFAELYRNVADLILAKEAGEASSEFSALLPGADAGLMGMRFIQAAWDSHQSNGAWVSPT